MSSSNQGYPLFGSPFNEVTDYGFDSQSLVTSFLPKHQRPSVHPNQSWKCTKSYCLYRNKKAIARSPEVIVKAAKYVLSNPLDIISTTSGDFVCHSTGEKLQTLRICKWNNDRLKHGGSVFDLLDEKRAIEGISHCTNYYNDETIILSWHRRSALFLGMSINNESGKPKFESIDELAPPSNCTFKSGTICPLPFVWDSGLEDAAFYASNGSLILTLNHGQQRNGSSPQQNNQRVIPLGYHTEPPWTEVMWTEHPRVVRMSCDLELLTIDLRQKSDQNTIQKHSYFDPITAITTYKHYIATVGLQGVGLYDDRMLKRPLNKWRFYDFDFVMGDGMFSRLQIYPLQSGYGEHWIIASGHGQRVLMFPIFSGEDSPIVSSMPFNINRYTECFGKDVRINALKACSRKGSPHIIAMSEYGSMLCTQFELKENEQKENEHKASDHNQNENAHLTELRMALHCPPNREKIKIPNSWKVQIESELSKDSPYSRLLNDTKIAHFARFLVQFEVDIKEFTQIPKTTEQIRAHFEGDFEDLDDLTMYDYYRVFMESDIGLHSFQIRSAQDIDDVKEGDIRNMVEVVTTYFVSQSLESADYLPIEEPVERKEDVSPDVEIVEDDDKEKVTVADSLDLATLGLLSQQASQQERTDDEMFSQNSQDAEKYSNNLSEMEFDGERLFKTQYKISSECSNLFESLSRKWRDGKKQYVDNDWRQLNGDNVDYQGMTNHKFPKRKKRRVKRAWK